MWQSIKYLNNGLFMYGVCVRLLLCLMWQSIKHLNNGLFMYGVCVRLLFCFDSFCLYIFMLELMA